MPVIGLHITKCGGTTIASQVKKQLAPAEFYLCSSYLENLYSETGEFWERIDTKQLRFIFGHYIHESLLGMQWLSSINLFTVLRSPKERKLSEYKQLAKIKLKAEQSPPDPIEFIQERGESLIIEICRGFPSVTDELGFGIEAVDRIMSFTDAVFFLQNPSKIEEWIKSSLSLTEIRLSNKVNVTSEEVQNWPTEFEKAFTDLLDIIAVDNEDALYRRIFAQRVEQSKNYDAKKNRAHLQNLDHEACVQEFTDHLLKYYLAEIEVSKTKSFIKKIMADRNDNIARFQTALDIIS